MKWVNFLAAFRGLLSYKFRAFLTTLGIIFAIAAVMVMVAIIEGAKRESLEIMVHMGGPSNIVIYSRPPEGEEVIPRKLTCDDALSIKKKSPFISALSPIRHFWGPVKYKDRCTEESEGLACWPSILDVEKFELEKGRFIVWEDIERSNKVVVLGAVTKEELFGNDSPIGENIEIEGSMYKVVGVLKKKAPKRWSTEGIKWLNRKYYLPITVAQRSMDEVSYIIIKAKDIESVDEAVMHIKPLLLARHDGTKDFEVYTAKGALEAVRKAIQIWTLVLGAIVGISLLIGGIGIMNIMLATVSERKKEIGIRRAVGANRMDILFQFLIEALIISITGGLVGIGIGVGGIQIVGLMLAAAKEGPVKTVVLTPSAVLLALFVSSLVGIFFGVYPAYKAAKESPIDALRYE
jgi:putative ABC transport system permease protein